MLVEFDVEEHQLYSESLLNDSKLKPRPLFEGN